MKYRRFRFVLLLISLIKAYPARVLAPGENVSGHKDRDTARALQQGFERISQFQGKQHLEISIGSQFKKISPQRFIWRTWKQSVLGMATYANQTPKAFIAYFLSSLPTRNVYGFMEPSEASARAYFRCLACCYYFPASMLLLSK